MKNFSCTYGLFNGNHSMESKIIEYGIFLLHKYKVEQTDVISRLLFTFFLTIIRTFGQIIEIQQHRLLYFYRHRTFTFCYYMFILLSRLRYHEFRKYSSNHILKVYKAPNQSFVKNISMSFKKM